MPKPSEKRDSRCGTRVFALYWRVFTEQMVFGAILGLIVYLFTVGGIVAPIRKLTTVMEELEMVDVEQNPRVPVALRNRLRDALLALKKDTPDDAAALEAYDTVRKLIQPYQ
jgi:hypothetical protein